MMVKLTTSYVSSLTNIYKKISLKRGKNSIFIYLFNKEIITLLIL